MALMPVLFIRCFLVVLLLLMFIVAFVFIVYNPNYPILWMDIAARHELTIWNV